MSTHEIRFSPVQQQLLDHLRRTGKVLRRSGGGLWCTEYPWIPAGSPWWGTQTVRALERLGVLVRCHRLPEAWRDDRMLSSAWLV
jgi:hypothetical protein